MPAIVDSVCFPGPGQAIGRWNIGLPSGAAVSIQGSRRLRSPQPCGVDPWRGRFRVPDTCRRSGPTHSRHPAHPDTLRQADRADGELGGGVRRAERGGGGWRAGRGSIGFSFFGRVVLASVAVCSQPRHRQATVPLSQPLEDGPRCGPSRPVAGSFAMSSAWSLPWTPHCWSGRHRTAGLPQRESRGAPVPQLDNRAERDRST